jgi:predicted unusual protein kinase regulating ubiquinone biosynthesis (AarF/ABC1/UbiB family)
MGQFALETARFAQIRANNPGNHKAASTSVDHTYFTTTELLSEATANQYIQKSTLSAPCTPGGRQNGLVSVTFRPDHPVCRFRAFATLDEGLTYHLSSLQKRFGKAWVKLLAGDSDGYVRALKAAGYFTGNEEDYKRAVKSLAREYLALPWSAPSTGATSATVA